MLSKRASQPTGRAPTLQEGHLQKCKTNNRDTSTTEQNKRARTKQIPPQTSLDDAITETDSLPWPTDGESTVDLNSNADHMDDIDENKEGETSETELGRHFHAGQRGHI